MTPMNLNELHRLDLIEQYDQRITELLEQRDHARQCFNIANAMLVRCEDNTEGYYTRIEAIGTASDGWQGYVRPESVP